MTWEGFHKLKTLTFQCNQYNDDRKRLCCTSSHCDRGTGVMGDLKARDVVRQFMNAFITTAVWIFTINTKSRLQSETFLHFWYATESGMRKLDTMDSCFLKKKKKIINVPEPKHFFFFLNTFFFFFVKIWHLHYTKFNSTVCLRFRRVSLKKIRLAIFFSTPHPQIFWIS